MAARKIISIFLVFMIVLPPIQGWGQRLEDQAQFYLQNIAPPQVTPSQPGQAPSTPAPVKSDLPRQLPPAPQPAQVLTTAPRQPEEISAAERRAWTRMMFVKQFGYSFFINHPRLSCRCRPYPWAPIM